MEKKVVLPSKWWFYHGKIGWHIWKNIWKIQWKYNGKKNIEFYFDLRFDGIQDIINEWYVLWCLTGRHMKNKVWAPLRGRAFLHMDIFLFNDVPRFRHNESGFSEIFIYCGCVKSHGKVWKNESLGVISLVFVGRKPSCWKRQLYAFSSLCFSRFCGKGLLDICTCRRGNFFAREKPRHISWCLSHSNSQLFYCSMSLMLNKILYIITICSVAYI